MKLLKKKYFTTILCIGGICALACGMAKRNDIIFLIGLILIISGYLFIRKELKSSTESKS